MAGRPRLTRVLFRVAGGPRIGFGHVMRALTLARACGIRPRVSLRGGRQAAARLVSFGIEPVAGPATHVLDPAAVRLLVVDDPSVRAAARWVRLAHARGIAVASVHDLGLGAVASDLAIDCSLPQPRHRWPAAKVLCGARHAILAPLLRRRRPARGPRPPVIVVGLGGGQQARAGIRLAAALARACPDADVRASAGLLGQPIRPPAGVTAIAPTRFRAELAAADLVVSGGGLTLYEAAAAGVPAVALAVVPAQRRTVTAFVRAGLALDAGRLAAPGGPGRPLIGRVVRHVCALLADQGRRARMARRGPQLIDGRGAARARAALEALYHAAGAGRDRARD